MGRASDVLAGDVLPRSGARSGEGEAGVGEGRAVQDRHVGQSRGDGQIQRQDLVKIAVATLTGMSVDEFSAEVKKWLAAAKDPRWKTPYTELTYLPMQEVSSYLRANGYRTYIVTGGGQDFVRVYSEAVGTAEQVVGTAGTTRYGFGKGGKPVLTRSLKFMLDDHHAGKPEGIHLEIGQRPCAAFGNSVGDRQMLEYTKAGEGARLSMLVLHDDAMREYAYGPAHGRKDPRLARSRRHCTTRRRSKAGLSSA